MSNIRVDTRQEMISAEMNQFYSTSQPTSVSSMRHRRKHVARAGGVFDARREKKRLYFCCICSAIDIDKLSDYLMGMTAGNNEWKFHRIAEALRLSKDSGHYSRQSPGNPPSIELDDETENNVDRRTGSVEGSLRGTSNDSYREECEKDRELDSPSHCAQELFIFEFGAVVFWGFAKGQETNLLKTIRMFAYKGLVSRSEFEKGEDDMGFSCSPEAKSITISSDVITLPEDTNAKQRLAVSYAIAQSSILSIFEARIEEKMTEYKYIPETLAGKTEGVIRLSARQVGIMTGEIFVIRHEVNLNTDILDIPDFLWEETKYNTEFKMTTSYLDIKNRVDLLNRRIDDLRELLEVLHSQSAHEHFQVRMEIICWAIFAYLVIEIVIMIACGFII